MTNNSIITTSDQYIKDYFKDNQELFLRIANSEIGRFLLGVKHNNLIFEIFPNGYKHLIGIQNGLYYYQAVVSPGICDAIIPLIDKILILSDHRPDKINNEFSFLKAVEFYANGQRGGNFPKIFLNPLQPAEDSNNYDVLLYQPMPTTNFASYGFIEIGWEGTGASKQEREAIKFDLSSLSAVDIVPGSTFGIYVTSISGSPTINVWRILAANSGWTKTGSTWNTIDGAVSWAGAAGCTSSGTDHSSTPMGTKSSFSLNAMNLWSLDETELADIITNNYGWIFGETGSDPGGSARRIQGDVMSSSTPSQRPILQVSYASIALQKGLPFISS